MSKKEAKSEALEKRLINNIGYCPECKKKHPKGKHDKESKSEEYQESRKESEKKMNKREENGDQED